MTGHTHTTHTEEETKEVARSFARQLTHGDVVALYGDLGSGKTRFVQGVCEAFGVHSHVSSPTFVILNRYDGKDADGDEMLVHHFDLYRVTSREEIYDLGYEEFLSAGGLCLIEWAENLGDLLPPERYDVHLSLGESEDIRRIEIRRVSGVGPGGGNSIREVVHEDPRH